MKDTEERKNAQKTVSRGKAGGNEREALRSGARKTSERVERKERSEKEPTTETETLILDLDQDILFSRENYPCKDHREERGQ